MPMNWPLGRVLETHLGQNGLIRVMTFKTAQDMYTRPVCELTYMHRTLSVEYNHSFASIYQDPTGLSQQLCLVLYYTLLCHLT